MKDEVKTVQLLLHPSSFILHPFLPSMGKQAKGIFVAGLARHALI
jgi:hypothetical protein